MRALLVWLVIGASGCGLILDGAYLIGGPKYSTTETQSKPTGHSQLVFEHEVRAEQGQLWLACEDIERSVDRSWTVKKNWEFQGGIYGAHWLPVILEGIIGAGIGIGVGLQCTKPGATIPCDPLWATIPLGVDVLYSAVRLLTIDPPKLVSKERQDAHAAPRAIPSSRRTVSCEPDAHLIVARTPEDPLAVHVRVDAWGAISEPAQQQLLNALMTEPTSQLFWSAGQQAPQTSGLERCAVLASFGRLGSGCRSPQ